MKIRLGCQNFNGQASTGRRKPMDYEAELQAIEASPASRTQFSYRIVPYVSKILQESPFKVLYSIPPLAIA